MFIDSVGKFYVRDYEQKYCFFVIAMQVIVVWKWIFL